MSVATRISDPAFDDDVLFARSMAQARAGGPPLVDDIHRLISRGRLDHARQILDHYDDPLSQARIAAMDWLIGHASDGLARCHDYAARVPTDYEMLDRLTSMSYFITDMATAREAARILEPEFLDPDFMGSIPLLQEAIAAVNISRAGAIARARILFGGSYHEIVRIGGIMHDLGSPNWNYFFWAKLVLADRFPRELGAIVDRASMFIKRGDVFEGARILATVAGTRGMEARELANLLAFCKAVGAPVTDEVMERAIGIAEENGPDHATLAKRWLGEGARSDDLHPEVADDLEPVRRAMPPIRARKPRIALCISGQLRSFHSVWPATAKLMESWEPVTFLSTWDNVGVGLGAHATIDRMLPRNIFEALTYEARNRTRFEQLFPTLFGTMMTARKADEAGLREFSGIEHVRVHSEADFDARFADAEGIKLKGNLNQPKMFAMLTDVNDQKSAYEREHNRVFDAVLRIRPDRSVSVLSPDDVERVSREPVLLTDYFLPVGIGDQFMLSSSAISNLVASIWPNLRDAGRPTFFDGATGRLNEFLLAEYVLSNRVNIGRFRGSIGSPIAAPALSIAEIWNDAATDFLAAPDDALVRSNFAALHGVCAQTPDFAMPEKLGAVMAHLG